jgi:hypothetical protein
MNKINKTIDILFNYTITGVSLCILIFSCILYISLVFRGFDHDIAFFIWVTVALMIIITFTVVPIAECTDKAKALQQEKL